MSERKREDRYTWKEGDVVTVKKMWDGKVVDKYPWEKEGISWSEWWKKEKAKDKNKK